MNPGDHLETDEYVKLIPGPIKSLTYTAEDEDKPVEKIETIEQQLFIVRDLNE